MREMRIDWPQHATGAQISLVFLPWNFQMVGCPACRVDVYEGLPPEVQAGEFGEILDFDKATNYRTFSLECQAYVEAFRFILEHRMRLGDRGGEKRTADMWPNSEEIYARLGKTREQIQGASFADLKAWVEGSGG